MLALTMVVYDITSLIQSRQAYDERRGDLANDYKVNKVDIKAYALDLNPNKDRLLQEYENMMLEYLKIVTVSMHFVTIFLSWIVLNKL